jgi:hypothetical protein
MDMKERGQRAAQLLSDPLVIETLDLIEQTIIQAWKETKEVTAREDLWYTLRGHQRFKTVLQSAIENVEFEDKIAEKYNVQSTK